MRYFLVILMVLPMMSSQNFYDYVEKPQPEIFEFGVKDGEEVFATTGRIGSTKQDHLMIIPIQIYDCFMLTYVMVMVTNRNTPPAVSVDFSERLVFFRYRHAQHSASTYKIVAYGVKDNDFCEDPSE